MLSVFPFDMLNIPYPLPSGRLALVLYWDQGLADVECSCGGEIDYDDLGGLRLSTEHSVETHCRRSTLKYSVIRLRIESEEYKQWKIQSRKLRQNGSLYIGNFDEYGNPTQCVNYDDELDVKPRS